MADPPPFQRLGRRLLRYGIPLVLAGALGAVLLLPVGSEPPTVAQSDDPTRFGPKRTLELTRCELSATDQALVLEGTTNLPAGASVELTIRARGVVLLSHTANVDGGAFLARLSSQGQVAPGAYEVVATFRLEAQPREIQERLHYQPRRLSARRLLAVAGAEAGGSIQARFERLFRAVNAGPRETETLARLDREARALGRELWLGQQKAALEKLRRAIEVARRPTFRRGEFDRLVVEAHVLAGL